MSRCARAHAVLRNPVLWLIRSRGLSVPEASENFRENRAEVVALVCEPACNFDPCSGVIGAQF